MVSYSRFYEKLYLYGMYLMYFLYFIIFFGISKTAPNYLTELEMIMKFTVSFILIIKYNPLYTKSTFTDIDKQIVFSTAVFLLMTTTLANFITRYVHTIKTHIQPMVR
jgi:hypothetical protein